MENRKVIVEGEYIPKCGCVDDQYIWILQGTSVYRYDITNCGGGKIIDVPSDFEKLRITGSNIVSYNRKLFIASEKKTCVLVINIDDYSEKEIRYAHGKDDADQDQYLMYFINGHEFFFIPVFADTIINVHENGDIDSYCGWKDSISKLIKIYPFEWGSYKEGYAAIVAKEEENTIVYFNKEMQVIDETKLSCNGKIRSLLCLERSIIVQNKEHILQFNPDEKRIVRKWTLPELISGHVFLKKYQNVVGILGANGAAGFLELDSDKIEMTTIPRAKLMDAEIFSAMGKALFFNEKDNSAFLYDVTTGETTLRVITDLKSDLEWFVENI